MKNKNSVVSNLFGAAAFYGNLKILKHLEGKRKLVNINYPAAEKADRMQKSYTPEFTGYTPVMLAAAAGHVEAIKALVALNCDLSVLDNFGNNLPLIAVKYNRKEAFKFIL